VVLAVAVAVALPISSMLAGKRSKLSWRTVSDLKTLRRLQQRCLATQTTFTRWLASWRNKNGAEAGLDDAV
jgi:hypothetical protein